MLLKLSKLFLYVSVFAVIIVLTGTFFPFIGGKDYFFRVSIELALIFFILWWAFEDKTGEAGARFREAARKPIFIAVSLFILAILLSTIFAYDPHAAFWSNFERGEGAFQILHYYAFFVLLVLTFREKEDWKRIFGASLIASALMILYGVFANLGWASNFISPYQGGLSPEVASSWWLRLTSARFQGSLGNPAYVAPYLLFSVFYAAYLWLDGKYNKKLWAGIGYGSLIIVFLFFFAITETRGAFMGLGLGVFAFLIYLALSRRNLRKWFIPFLIFLAIAGGLLVRERHAEWMKNLPGGRLFDIAFSDQTVQTRLWTWGSAWDGFKERPVFGWGLENFTTVFDKYFNPEHYVPGANSETWFDRAHSIYFDYLTETGILGLLGYLSIFAVIFWKIFRKRRGGGGGYGNNEFRAGQSRGAEERNSAAESGSWKPATKDALLFSLSIAYLVQGAAIFDVLPIYINLFLFFAFANYYFAGNNGASSKHSERVRFPAARQSETKEGRREENGGGGRGTVFGSPCRKLFKTEGFEKRA